MLSRVYYVPRSDDLGAMGSDTTTGASHWEQIGYVIIPLPYSGNVRSKCIGPCFSYHECPRQLELPARLLHARMGLTLPEGRHGRAFPQRDPCLQMIRRQ